jgi:hypothetical protein
MVRFLNLFYRGVNMTERLPNLEPIGAEYGIGKRTFAADTTRAALADALEAAGRLPEAELLRGPDPVVLDHHPVRRPGVGDVVRVLRRLMGDLCGPVSISGSFPEGYSQIHLDEWEPTPTGRYERTDRAYRVRWPAGATGRVFVALRTRAANSLRSSVQVVLALTGTGVPMEMFRRVPADEGIGPTADVWEQVALDGAHPT